MPTALRQFWIVARYELIDAVRSRRAVTLLLLYLLGSLAASNLFVHVVHRIENRLVEAMQLTPYEEAGGVTRALWQSDHFRHMLAELVGDRELAKRLLSVPPLSIFYGWLSFTFGPLLVLLMSCPRVAEEVGAGSARFVLFRTTRGIWCCGKFAGQAVMLLAALLVSGLAAWIVGLVRMSSFESSLAALAILVFSSKAWLYSLAYLGLALGVSQTSRSPIIATAIGLMVMTALTVLALVSQHWQGPGWRRLLDLTLALTPRGNNLLLWHLDAPHLVPGLILLPALGLLYFSIGHIVFARRDL